jgi:uncharacterized protein YjdB
VSGPSAVFVGGAGQFVATVSADSGASDAVKWSSSNAGVAAVAESGVVTGVAAGTATITATSVATPSVSGSASVVVPAPVSTVAVTALTLTLFEGDATIAVATPMDANGVALRDRAVTWSSNQPAVATVSSTGVVTAVAFGTAIITATSEGKSGSVTITVSLSPVSVVLLAPPSLRLVAGTLGTLFATLADARGIALFGRTVAWSSSDNRVATVNASGVVAAISDGSATIVATSEGKSAAVVVVVTPAPVASVTLSATALELVVGDLVTLVAEARDFNGSVLTGRTITWSSSDAAVANVNASGVIVAISSGTATIQATSEGRVASAIATVIAPIQRSFVNVCVDPTLSFSTQGVCGTITFQTVNRSSGGTDVTVWMRSEQGSMPWNDGGVSTAVDGFTFYAYNMGVPSGPTTTRTEGRVAMLGTGALTSAFFSPELFFGGIRVWSYDPVNGGLHAASIGCRSDLVTVQYRAPFALAQHCTPMNLDGQLRIDFKMSGVFTTNDLYWLIILMQWDLPNGTGAGGGCIIPGLPGSGTSSLCVNGPR